MKKNDTLPASGPEIIVAAGLGGEIGISGEMIWHIPADLKRFKQITLGSAVVMGRKTWESLPKRPLPGRRNIIVSRGGYAAEGAETVASISEALEAGRQSGRVFIIGGSEIYRQTLPLASVVHLTRIFSRCPDAEAYFPRLDPEEWEMTDASSIMSTGQGVRFRFETYRRK